MLRPEVRRNLTYSELDRYQRVIAERVRGGGEGAILLSEVAPVITLGRRTPQCDVLLSKDELSAKGVELYPTDRGGFATYHGPGQWVLFIVESLEKLTGNSRGVRVAVEMLLEIGLEVASHYEAKSEIREGTELGVWTPRGKVAAVGVHVQDGVLLHGLSINGFKTETSFLGLKPCGLDLPVDYLVREAQFEELAEKILEIAEKRLQTQSRFTVKLKSLSPSALTHQA